MSAINSGDAQAIIDITRDATLVKPIPGIDDLVVITDSDGSRVEDIDPYRPHPRRTKRAVVVTDTNSFLDYVTRPWPGQLEIWADDSGRTVKAVLNAPDALQAGWCDHTCTLTLTPSPAWQAWIKASGQLMPQLTFAEHIEDNLPDIVRPTGAEMLELAQTFQTETKGRFQSHQFLADGMRALQFVEDGDAKAGRRGQITIPATFDLGLKPFVGAEAYKLTARLRWRITDGDLRIGYKLDRPAEVAQAAFDDMVAEIGANVDVRVNSGKP